MASMDGNTREVLRRLRDTFLDERWARYKDPFVWVAFEEVLIFLASADVVTPHDVAWVGKLLPSSGLSSVDED